MVLRYVPSYRPTSSQKFDFAGALMLFISLLCLLLALTLGQERGFGTPPVLALLAGFGLSLALFVIFELHSRDPMIDLRLFRNRYFSISLGTAVLTFIASAGTVLLMPFYLENVLGYDTRQVGLMLVVVPVMLGISAPISGALSDRVGTRPISTAGLAILLLGYLAVSTLSIETTILGYILRFVPVGLGVGIFQSPNNSAIMGTAPRERLGIVSGMLALSRTLGQTIGIAILGAIWASRVFHYAGGTVTGGATQAGSAFQVAGLQDTLLIIAGLVAAALSLSIFAMIGTRKGAS